MFYLVRIKKKSLTYQNCVFSNKISFDLKSQPKIIILLETSWSE